MGKGTHFFGQPIYGQLIKCLDKAKIVEMETDGVIFGVGGAGVEH